MKGNIVQTAARMYTLPGFEFKAVSSAARIVVNLSCIGKAARKANRS